MNLRSDVCLVGISGDQSYSFDHIESVGFALDLNHSNHMAFNICLDHKEGHIRVSRRFSLED